jgi:hypothetical protein
MIFQPMMTEIEKIAMIMVEESSDDNVNSSVEIMTEE